MQNGGEKHICASHLFSKTYQAWRAQMGSTSVTYMTALNAFSAAQQPLPTYKGERWKWSEELGCSGEIHHLTDLAITAHHHLFPSKHDVGGSLQPETQSQYSEADDTVKFSPHQYVYAPLPVQYGLLAAVEIVELLLGYWVVDVHGGDAQLAGLWQLVQPETTKWTSMWRTVETSGEWSSSFLCMSECHRKMPVTLSSTMPLSLLNKLG